MSLPGRKQEKNKIFILFLTKYFPKYFELIEFYVLDILFINISSIMRMVEICLHGINKLHVNKYMIHKQ